MHCSAAPSVRLFLSFICYLPSLVPASRRPPFAAFLVSSVSFFFSFLLNIHLDALRLLLTRPSHIPASSSSVHPFIHFHHSHLYFVRPRAFMGSVAARRRSGSSFSSSSACPLDVAALQRRTLRIASPPPARALHRTRARGQDSSHSSHIRHRPTHISFTHISSPSTALRLLKSPCRLHPPAPLALSASSPSTAPPLLFLRKIWAAGNRRASFATHVQSNACAHTKETNIIIDLDLWTSIFDCPHCTHANDRNRESEVNS